MPKLEYIGIGGHVAGFDVLIRDSMVIVMQGEKELLKHKIPIYNDTGKMPRVTKLRHATTEDFNIIQLVTETKKDIETGQIWTFGYCLNIECPDLSEWGWW